jgi:sodium/proline symporter
MLSGMVLAAVLAAICSTADSQLVVAASALANDLYARLFSRNKSGRHVNVNRMAVLLLGAGAILLVANEGVQVYQYVLTYGWAILGAAFGPQMILTLFWRRATYVGCIAGMATGFLVPIVWKQLCDRLGPDLGSIGSLALKDVYNLPLAFVLAFVANVVVSLLVPHSVGTTDPELDPLCPQCGYGLRGLTGSTCPECGMGLDDRHPHRPA